MIATVKIITLAIIFGYKIHAVLKQLISVEMEKPHPLSSFCVINDYGNHYESSYPRF
jgi:hypothetical protein